LSGTVANVSVTVAVAAIAADLDASLSVTAVAVVAMNVAMAFAMPLAGSAARALGARTLLIASGALIVAASVLLGLAPSVVVLGLARVVQGVALAAITPISVQVSTQLLEGPRRARALGWWAASNGLGLALGPALGGVLVETGGWRLVAVPAAVLGLALAATAAAGVPRGLRHDPGFGLRDVTALSVAAGCATTVVAALAARAWAVAALAAASGVTAALRARRRAREGGALAGFGRWLGERDVCRTSAGASLQMITNGMVQITVPAWLIVEGHATSATAGAALMAMTLTMAAMGPVTGRRPDVPYRRWLAWGLTGCAAGLAILAGATAGPRVAALPALVLTGLGAGALLSPSLTAFSRTDAGHNAVGLSMFNVLRLGAFGVGGLIGGTALDAGEPWAAFLVGAVACLGSLPLARRTATAAP
jgi:MFS family permease